MRSLRDHYGNHAIGDVARHPAAGPGVEATVAEVQQEEREKEIQGLCSRSPTEQQMFLQPTHEGPKKIIWRAAVLLLNVYECLVLHLEQQMLLLIWSGLYVNGYKYVSILIQLLNLFGISTIRRSQPQKPTTGTAAPPLGTGWYCNWSFLLAEISATSASIEARAGNFRNHYF